MSFPKGDTQLSERKRDTTLGERGLGGFHGLFDTKHQRGGEMQNPQRGKITKLQLKPEKAPGMFPSVKSSLHVGSLLGNNALMEKEMVHKC